MPNTPKNTGKNNKQKQLYSRIPYKQPPITSSGFIAGCLKLQKSSRQFIWSGHAVGTQCPRLTSNDKQRIGRSRDHLKYFRDWAVPGCRLSGFLEYSGHNNPLFDDFLDFGGRLSSFLKLLGRNASFKAFDSCHSSQRALSGHPAIPCGWPRTGSIVLKFLTEASFHFFFYC